MNPFSVLRPGEVFAHDFEIIRPLAEGGMGAVYIVRQRSTGRERALKVMLPQLVADASSRARFQQEAQIGARIESEHIVEVIAAGVEPSSGMPWLAMELLRGEDLESLIQRSGRLPVSATREILEQVGHAVAAAHRIGLVHRDLKPANIFVASSQRKDQKAMIKVLDFGIAKLLQDSKTSGTTTHAMGSPLWMAPEQTEKSGRISPATDVWAIGLIAFQMLTGKSYWMTAGDGDSTIQAILREILIDPMDSASVRAKRLDCPISLPSGFDDWFAQCVARSAAERFRDASSALMALTQVLRDDGAPSWTPPASTPPPQRQPEESLRTVPLSSDVYGATLPRPDVQSDSSAVPSATTPTNVSAPPARRIGRYASVIVAVTAALAMVAMTARSYALNQDLEHTTMSLVQKVGTDRNAPLTLVDIDALRGRMEQLQRLDEHPPLSMRFGMFKGHTLLATVQSRYLTAMGERVVSPMLHADERLLQAPDGNTSRLYAPLKLHLTLSQPRATGEPSLTTPAVQTFAGEQLAAEWLSLTGAGDALLPTMRRNTRAYVAMLAERPQLAIPRNTAAVTAARAALTRGSSVDMDLNEIIETVESMGYSINLTQAIGRPPEQLYQVSLDESRSVRGAFTRQGWEHYVRDRLGGSTEVTLAEPWVLGQTPPSNADVVQRRQALRSQYFHAYIEEWSRFMASIRVRSPDDVARSQYMLQWMTSGSSPPYVTLFHTIANNLHLTEPGSPDSVPVARQHAVDEPYTRLDVESDPVLRALADFGTSPANATPSEIALYQEQLGALQEIVSMGVIGRRNPNPAEVTRIQQISVRVETLLNRAAVNARPVLRNLLPPPVTFTSEGLCMHGWMARLPGTRVEARIQADRNCSASRWP